MTTDEQKVKIYKANLELQKRIGTGPLDKHLVERAQSAIENNDVDFTPLGLKFLDELKNALTKVNEKIDPEQVTLQKKMLTEPVMELKANATIFHYALVGNLANIMLSFLESIQELDKDALSIVGAHHDTLRAIVTKKMKGDGGEHGQIMMSELKDACARYYKKKKKEKKQG